MKQELKDSFIFYTKENKKYRNKITLGIIGIVATISLGILLPVTPVTIWIGRISLILFMGFFIFFLWGISQRPSAEKRIFANLHRSLEHLDDYKREHRKEDSKKAKKYLQMAMNLIRNSPSYEFKIFKKEIDKPLGELRNNLNSILIPSISGDQIDNYLDTSYDIIETLADEFYRGDLGKIKKISKDLKNKIRGIQAEAPKRGFKNVIRDITKTSVGLIVISVASGYFIITLIVSLFSLLFGWQMSDPVIGSAIILGGASITYLIHKEATGKLKSA